MEREEKIQLGLAIGSVTAFIIGWRRIAGAVALYDGYRAYKRHHNAHAGFSAAIGSAFLLRPSWPDDIGDALRGNGSTTRTPTLPAPAPIANYANLTKGSVGDELLDGNWTMYDMTDTQSPAVAAKSKSLRVGDTAALVLGSPGAPPMVFKVKVIAGGNPGRYAAQWITEPPHGGPQMADFAPAHMLSS